MTVLRPQATVLKSSPAPRDNSFDCSHITTNPRLVHLTGMTHCASFSGMEQFGFGSRGTVNCFTTPAIFKIFL
jgi:hypothetical protein